MWRNDSSRKKSSSKQTLKERDVRHVRIEDVSALYEIYEFQEEIGHGSFGIVVSVVEKQTNENYAVKIVNKYSTVVHQLSKVYREIKILKTVNHPNIVYLYKVFESAKKIYMVMERCRGNLKEVFENKKPFSEKTTKKIIKQLANAVYYLHKNQIVHRDIKMENILLSKNPDNPTDLYFIKLSDFGLSVIKAGSFIQGMMHDRCGTMLYMAPEILLERTYSELCDVWSIGIILYTLLCAKYPFADRHQEELINQICSKDPDYSPIELTPDAVDLLKCILVRDA
ncbi:unnamed protein product [Acanthoscelides obtectus]|uniref:Protein kinase domain-containing protein n=1 Tax=Acanthoscelides obtectus TaxID=200917 RepID=A0A9P0PBV0_ACAOB|nr:unnamed protein product [Acanthoscelides obtectus]CAK1622138.1 Serine/threonine-protein kinase 33 [Acanthoscelides obtectus]